MKLTKVIIHKYKSIETDQEFNIEDDITILVGMNESGKTAALEAIAKTNYFQNDNRFKFNMTHDYPRREKKTAEKLGKPLQVITCYYEIDEKLQSKIDDDLGIGVFTTKKFSETYYYSSKTTNESLACDKKKFIEQKLKKFGKPSITLTEKLMSANNKADFQSVVESYKDQTYIDALKELSKYYENQWNWQSDSLCEYVTRVYLNPNIPKFLYYDEYYTLPSRVSLEDLLDDNLDEVESKTAKALIELADLNLKEILESNDFEDFTAELEATEAIISDAMFKYWHTNDNLGIVFKVEPVEKIEEKQIRVQGVTHHVENVSVVEHVLDIRVRNSRTGVTLPLKNRSKGFNWFFSFLVWFKKIQEDKGSKYILLLDEPGLNLHASAQNDLLNFLEDLSSDYQIIYTTHSPFMIESGELSRVRTVLETKEGTKISESISEKDPNTLFPLQAALGYDIAQNLYISDKNLLVEGVSDLIFLETMSGILEASGRESLKKGVTIVPTGGLEKVATFISLLRGSKLDIVCLLDSYTDPKSKANMEKMIREKIIQQKKIRHYAEFIGKSTADIEDVFHKDDYLRMFNGAFAEHNDISVADLDDRIDHVVIQLNKFLGVDHYNHYRPANHFAKTNAGLSELNANTIDNFENIFKEINKLF